MLNFINIGTTGKTQFCDVLCNGVTLGKVKWYAPWRRYTFHPASATIFDRSCLLEIIAFIDG